MKIHDFRGTKLVLLVAALCGVTICASAAPSQYTITDLGTLGGSQSFGLSINATGQVAGIAYLSDNQVIHAFLYSNGTMTDLGTFTGYPGAHSLAFGINASGQVTGFSDAAGGYHFAFLYSNGTLTNIGTVAGQDTSIGFGINASGQVTGETDSYSIPYSHAFLYTPGTGMSDLGTNSVGRSINDSGQVTGTFASGTGYYHAFLYSAGAMTDLGALSGGNNSYGYGINSSGQVTGYSEISSGSLHAFLYSAGAMMDLGTLAGADNSYGYGINSSGQVTGCSSSTVGSCSLAILYTPGTGIVDLNTLLQTGSGWTLIVGYAINDNGQITGYGTLNGQNHAFLLTPVPPYQAFIRQPINSDGSSVFDAKRGVVPVKFTLALNNVATCTLPPATITVTRTSGGTLGTVDESLYMMAADNGSNFRIDSGACQYIYNLGSSSLGAGVYLVNIVINGSVVGNGVFGLK